MGLPISDIGMYKILIFRLWVDYVEVDGTKKQIQNK